jgi:deoxyribodipyrimidine photolyase-related protein
MRARRRIASDLRDAGFEVDQRRSASLVAGVGEHRAGLMILGNLALLAGVDPQAMTRWMWAGFVDGAEWVMVPNVVGRALHADGGMMATKPYAAGGASIG